MITVEFNQEILIMPSNHPGDQSCMRISYWKTALDDQLDRYQYFQSQIDFEYSESDDFVCYLTV